MNSPLTNEDLSILLMTLSAIFIILSLVGLYKLHKHKAFKRKTFAIIILIASIIALGYGISINQGVISSKPVYPTLTSSVPKESLELNADLLISMLPKEAHNCNTLNGIYEDIKKTIKSNEDDPNMSENLKINLDLFNIIAYKLGLKCSFKK